ncbi:MAG: hypothetical protein KBG01_07995 [Syntrophobacterales bacterium]|jgi:hypothetical protein|nr:hypothetical protein [Syntrophobacterales bacterium]
MGFYWKIFLLPLVLLLTVVDCGGNGSGGGGGNPSTPTISNVTFMPSRLPRGTRISNNLYVSFDWTDGGGDLNGGTFTLIYEGKYYTTPLTAAVPPINPGSTNGHVNQLYLSPFTLSSTSGVPRIQVRLTDNAGNASSLVFVTNFYQT